MPLIQRLHFLSRANMLKPIRAIIRDIASAETCSDEDVNKMLIAINEACMNIIQHAYKGDAEGEIILEFWHNDNCILIKIFDFADSIDRTIIKSRDLSDIRPGGLGVHLITEVMDKVEYLESVEGKGNIIQMEKYI